MFEKIKRFFEMKLYTERQIYAFAEKGVITTDEADEICRRRGE